MSWEKYGFFAHCDGLRRAKDILPSSRGVIPLHLPL